MVFHPIMMHAWLMKVVPYLTVSKRLIANTRANHWATIGWRLGLHMVILMPYMQGSVIFGIGAFKELSISAGISMFKERFWDGLLFAYLYWPFIMLGLYSAVPPRFGNLYMDCWNIIWQSCVSWVANRDKSEPVPTWGLLYRKVCGKLKKQ